MKIKPFITALLLIFTCMPLMAQQKLFTLEDLNFGGKNYHNLRPKNMFLTWWGNQLMYQDAEEGGTVDNKGNKKVLFNLKEVGADFHSAMNAKYPYADQPLVLLSNGKRRILYNFKTKAVVWQQDMNQNEANQHWNKTSKAVAFTRNHQLYVRDADGIETQLTTDGSRDIVYGEAVHRNEFGINEGIFWSPDGKKFAFYRMDQSMVTDYPQVNIDPRIAEVEPDKYPMAGMTSHEVKVGIYDLNLQKVTYLKTNETYLTNIAWSPDSKEVFMFELNRDQNDCKLKCYDASTGKYLYMLNHETSSKYVEPMHPIQFLPWDKNLFIMQSQKDGFNHLYLCSIKGEIIKQLTQGSWVVLDVLGFNEKSQSVIIASNEKHPLQRNIYSVSVKTGKRTLLDNGEGVHHGNLSTTGQKLVDKYSTPSIPNAINIIEGSKKSYQLLLADDPWSEYVTPQFECGSIKAADGVTDLYYRMVKPADFDASKKYPTIVYVYGGPHAHNVEASWHWYSRSWETYMAQKGYIVFILDNRGSENRGLAFEQATFRQLGQIEMLDQMKGVDYLKSLPYVDTNRLGVHGWSFGGFMTISLMTNYPDVFKVGVAGGPVIDWKWYEVMYGERYMDTPESNPEGYAKTSLINKASQLKGKLQIIIGYNDPTCVPQHTLSFLKACAEAGTQPDFFAYPGEEHNMRGHASVHLHERITQYFEDYLK
ncbi:S9 family peptidase [Prevotella sp. E13-17]|uniref:S9 family peptidase n=1 Tax=Prevotella sp. E13-17 TaxID=2913616 RepID=UPI001EDACC7E|nr:S9 family peptidase [Prevotella sp. E13-17]UKK52325.1 S9 family peptidase [Prevotella sp. E13-17]